MNIRQESRQITVWLLALVMVFAQSGLPSMVLAQRPEPLELEQTIDQLERLFMALEAAAKEIPRDTFDPEAILDEVDLEAEALFHWVRDNTYLVPYRGALRGPVGVLMDRMGNSLDRALLLSELLHLLGYDTRLVRAQLSVERAEDLLVNLRPIPGEGVLPQQDDADQTAHLQQYTDQFGLDQAQISEIIEQNQQQEDRLQAEMIHRVEMQTAFLFEVLGAPIGDVEAERAAHLAALQDYWWVQYQEGGVWTDLDPALPDAVPGETLTDADEILMAATIDDLSQSLLHTLQIRVVLECAVDGGLQETVLVESPVLVPANLLGQRIVIQHVPVDMPQSFDTSDSMAFKELILEQDRWFPIITIGSQSMFDHDYTASCEVGIAALPLPGAAVGGAFEQALDVFGGLGTADGTEQAGESVTAQWIEYSIHVPGEAEQVIRRQIFDVLGPVARSANNLTLITAPEQQLAWRLALFGETEILPIVNWLSPTYVNFLAASHLIIYREMVLELLRYPSNQNKIDEAVGKLVPLPSQLYALALIRRAGFIADGYIARPNIMSYHKQHKLNVQGNVAMLEGFDIVSNQIAVAPSATNSFFLRLKQGVMDTNTEAFLAAAMCQDYAQIACPQIVNTSEALEASNVQGIAWRTIRSLNELDELGVSSDTYLLLEQELVNGFIVVVPEALVRVGNDEVMSWWRIDPASGGSLGLIETGWGASLVEWLYIIRIGFTGFFAMACVSSVNSLEISDSGKGLGLILCTIAGSLMFAGVFTAGMGSLSGLISGVILDVVKTLGAALPYIDSHLLN